MYTEQMTVEPVAPFNFDGTMHVPHYFPTPDCVWRPGKMWRTLNFQRLRFGLKMENLGDVNRPSIRLKVFSTRRMGAEATGRIGRELEWRYGFSEDLAGFYEEFKDDGFLKPAFKRLRGMRANCENSLYELMIISIVLQNATVKRTVQMMDNLFNAYGSRLKFDGKQLLAYWSPEDLNGVSEEQLRLLKVGYRAKTIKKVSATFARREIDEIDLRRMSTEDAKRELMKLPGVGPATAQIILTGYLRRYDVFDLKGRRWEQKILSRVMYKQELVNAEEIVHEFDERYGKWRGLAFHYIFTDLFWKHKEKEIPWLQKEIRM